MKPYSIVFIFLYCMVGLSKARPNGVGGGYIVECPDHLESLDLYEMRYTPPYRQIDLGQNDWSLEEKLYYVLSRLTRLDPTKSHTLLEYAKHFLEGSHTRWVQGIRFLSNPDYGYVPPLPNKCQLRQIAIQKTPANPIDRFYTLDQGVWQKLQTNSQTAMVLHEIVYRYALELGHQNSVNVRRFVGFLCSTDLETMTEVTYYKLVETLFPQTLKLAFRSDQFEYILFPNELFSLDLYSLLVKHPGASLHWGFLESVPSFMKLSKTEGILQVNPSAQQPPGSFHFNLFVINDIDGAVVPLTFKLAEEKNYPPIWVVRSFMPAFSVTANAQLQWDLSPYVTDQEGDPMELHILYGPTWLSVSGNSLKVAGTPPLRSTGMHEWAVAVSSNKQSAIATLKILVEATQGETHDK